MHAIQAFRHSRSSPQIIVFIHPSLRDDWSTLCESHAFSVPHTLVNGGSSRFESVKNGLKAMASIGAEMMNCIIAVHDAARPLVSPKLIDATYQQAKRTGAAALLSEARRVGKGRVRTLIYRWWPDNEK